METEIKIVCNETNIANTIRIWRKRKGWLFIHKSEYEKSIIEIYHYDTKIASLFRYYGGFKGGLWEDEKIYLIIEKKLEQGYSLTDRRFFKALIGDDAYASTAFKKWVGKIKRYSN